MHVRPLLAPAILLAVWAGGWTVLSSARGDEGAKPAPVAVKATYVGAAACARCHAGEHALWQTSSHAHTFEEVGEHNLPAEVWASGTVQHPPGQTRFERVGERVLAHTLGPDGQEVAYALTHVVGRMRIRMYVATLPDGRRQVLPAMLEVPTGEWFDYTHLIFGAPGLPFEVPPLVKPGEASFWTGPVRSWDSGCARCHESGSAPVAGAPVDEGPRLEFRVLGVDCEMCHGPGSTHVDWHDEVLAGRTPTGVDPLLDIGALDASRATGICLQCHMEADLVDRSFLPGGDIFEHVDPTLLVSPERVDPSGRVLELIYDGLPFGTSRCAAAGNLTCFTCHDPHGSSHASQLRRAPHDPAHCIGCHVEIGNDIPAHTHHSVDEGPSCVACHMPFLSIERGHGFVADHTISIPRLGSYMAADRLAADACTTCHAPEGAPLAQAEPLAAEVLATAYATWWPDPTPVEAWALALGAARAKQPGAAALLMDVFEDRDLPSVVRASAIELLGKQPEEAPLVLLRALGDEDGLVRRRAVSSLAGVRSASVDRLLLQALADPSRAVRLVAARTALAGFERARANRALLEAALPILEDDVKTIPEDPVRWYVYAAALDMAGRTREALVAWRNMVRLDPFAPAIEQRIAAIEAELAAESGGSGKGGSGTE